MMCERGIVVSVLCVACLSVFAPAGRCENRETSPTDRARELVRREAQKAAATRDAAFDRIRGLPQVEVKVNGAARIIMRRLDLDAPTTTLITALIQPLGLDGRPDLAAEPTLEVLEASFDLSVFGSTGDKASANTHLNSLLHRTIGHIAIARERPLVEVQQKKLLLAGRGDIKRLFDRIEEARAEFNTLRADVSRCDEFLSSLLPLSRELRRGPFDRADSLLQKMLRRIDGTVRMDSATR